MVKIFSKILTALFWKMEHQKIDRSKPLLAVGRGGGFLNIHFMSRSTHQLAWLGDFKQCWSECVVYFKQCWSECVVYFEQLQGAASTQKLVFFGHFQSFFFFSNFLSFFHLFCLKKRCKKWLYNFFPNCRHNFCSKCLLWIQ